MKDLKDTLVTLVHALMILACLFGLLGYITMLGHGDAQYQQKYIIEEAWK